MRYGPNLQRFADPFQPIALSDQDFRDMLLAKGILLRYAFGCFTW